MSESTHETAVSLPAPALRSWIAGYAGFRACGLPPGVHYGLPSSDIDLIISLGQPIEVVRMPNPRQHAAYFTAFVNGLQDAPAIVRQEADVFGIHVFIRPLGVRTILGVPSGEFAGLVASLSDLWGRRAEDLAGKLRTARSWRERFEILDRVFLSRQKVIAPPSAIAWAWDELRRTHGSLPIQRLAQEIGWSRRHFSARFREAIGVTPKSSARVFRFERACRLIRDHHLDLAQVAATCGYFDQAHLSHEWKALAGCSPKTWIARELPFLQDYELGGCDDESYAFESADRAVV